MRIQVIISLLFLSFSFHCFAQTIYGAVAPDSIKKKCEALIIDEIGKENFLKHVKLIKSDAHTKNKVLQAYTLFYSFSFPNVKESHVVFTLEYIFGKGLVKDITFNNYTRLPGNLKKKGTSIVTFADAKKTALAADTTLKKYQTKLYGELSTEYDTVNKDYFFVWYFYYLEPCKNCEAESYTTHSVFINATSGKVIHQEKK